VDSTDFRRAMALLPTGVSVVTALANGAPAGATAGAVSSLSLDPPLMLAALDRGSRTLGALRESHHFAVNVLGAENEELAHRFSTKEHHTVKWDGIEWTERAGAPWITGSVLAVTCALRDLHDGGDHVIATGEVLEVDAPGGEPLVFWRGAYRGLGEDG
jgi:3-hydroxy-9,10-secoandrosta-1,3,5(10)-triene-9,17-dione monooxygenase reductase component